ncbi:MAG: DEAD/DEAH box helicase family protein [Treponema sp.]|nr:DEAD/DEAH box helicase family protein [Treponema sp.]
MELSYKQISDIHFSLHSVITKQSEATEYDLKKLFYRWISARTEYEDYYDIDWLCSPISKTDFPDDILWSDIIDYAEGLPCKKHSLSQTENDERKILRMDTAEILFDRFLHEGLTSSQRKWVEETWNQNFNSFQPANYDNFDYTLQGFSGTYDGKKFTLHEQQKKGFAFLCSKGNGLLAYDVGVGKTATGIAALIYQLQQGKCSRPLIIVPKAVYSKWLHDIRELFPNVTLNELKNLNKDIIDKLRMNSVFAEENDGLLIPNNSLSICTAEAMEKIYFKPDTQPLLEESFSHILTKKKQKEYFTPSEGLEFEQYVFFEELGIDLLLVDEAHRYKNLIKKVTGSGYSEFSRLGFGEPSSRAVKMFAITEYIHRHNKEKNVFFLSATPFTNSPMEIYTMLLFTGGNEIRSMGYRNINDFLNEFAEIKIEWTVNNKNEVVRKTVMKNFRSLDALQKIIQNYIDKVDAEDAHINRPEKETHVIKIEMTNLQKKIYDSQIQRLTTAFSLDTIFSAMNTMRMCLISPTLVKDKNIKVPDLSEFVTASPKILLVCDSVIKIYKEKPDCGQIIYLPRGVKEFTAVKNYLIKNKIPEAAIGMMNSSTSESRKEKITKAFNNPSDPLKILIGSETISEGVDLNGNSLVLYNCMLGWNPTEPLQVEGRLWRQGNRQKKVHIVYPLMYNSLDSLIYQKHDEKASRIDAIWEYRGDKINVEEINPAELKFDLIKSPEMKADIVLEQRSLPLKRELKIIEESRSLLTLADERIALILNEIDELQKQIDNLNNEIKESLEKNKDMPEAFQHFSDMIINNAKEEKKTLEQEISGKKKKIALVEANLKKKMGTQYSDKADCLSKLAKKQSEIEKQIELLNKDRDNLIELYKSQYIQQKYHLQSIPKLVDSLAESIMENTKS